MINHLVLFHPAWQTWLLFAQFTVNNVGMTMKKKIVTKIMFLNNKHIYGCFWEPGVGFSLLYAMSSYILKEICNHHLHPGQSNHKCSHDYDVVVGYTMCMHYLVSVADVRLEDERYFSKDLRSTAVYYNWKPDAYS